jgi:hypothetical protein
MQCSSWTSAFVYANILPSLSVLQRWLM